jgi:hypothetical protein
MKLSSFVLQKRCPNCKRIFGLKMQANGKQEYPCNFKKRQFCSIKCGSIASAARKGQRA